MDLNANAGEALSRIREKKPLIHQITNYVVSNDTANVTLHLGALPVMAHAIEEVEEMVAMAGALLLNIGTLSTPWVEAMLKAGKKANELEIPVVLDPVGAGATSFRTETAERILDQVNISVVRGNLGEIATLAGLGGKMVGVDSMGAFAKPIETARSFAKQRGVCAAITGQVDVVSDGARVVTVKNGHELLGTLTGTGCASTTAVACFMAVEEDPVLAASGALAAYGLAAEKAAKTTSSPASFKVAFHDALYHLTDQDVRLGGKADFEFSKKEA